MPNVEVGWLAFLKGKGRDLRLVRVHSGKDYGPPPSVEHKECFRLVASLEGVVHEIVSPNSLLWGAFSDLDDAFLAGKDEHHNELPLGRNQRHDRDASKRRREDHFVHADLRHSRLATAAAGVAARRNPTFRAEEKDADHELERQRFRPRATLQAANWRH
jgi:hypothetical protein